MTGTASDFCDTSVLLRNLRPGVRKLPSLSSLLPVILNGISVLPPQGKTPREGSVLRFRGRRLPFSGYPFSLQNGFFAIAFALQRQMLSIAQNDNRGIGAEKFVSFRYSSWIRYDGIAFSKRSNKEPHTKLLPVILNGISVLPPQGKTPREGSVLPFRGRQLLSLCSVTRRISHRSPRGLSSTDSPLQSERFFSPCASPSASSPRQWQH